MSSRRPLKNNHPVTVGVFVPSSKEKIRKPSETPIGRAFELIPKNIQTVFGYSFKKKGDTVCLSGKTVNLNSDSWIDVTVPIDAVHDRYPSQQRAHSFQQAYQLTRHLPFGNSYSVTMLCRDKIATQDLLTKSGIPMPDLCIHPSSFKAYIQTWGQAFVKPRYGALGQNVSLITTPEDVPEQLQGVVPGRLEPTILQRAVPPPKGWAGMSARHLVQKSVHSAWISNPIVLRRSTHDPVVNVARGAKAVPAADVLPKNTIEYIKHCSIKVAEIIDKRKNGGLCVEIGIDYVIDQNFKPWLIEVNSRPRGRLEVLANQDPERFLCLHRQACIQPILYLAATCQSDLAGF